VHWLQPANPVVYVIAVGQVSTVSSADSCSCCCCCCCSPSGVLRHAVVHTWHLQVPAWRPDAFLASLEPAALHPALSARLSGNASTAAATLYSAFIESPNFAFWFKERRAPVLHLVEDEVCGNAGSASTQSISGTCSLALLVPCDRVMCVDMRVHGFKERPEPVLHLVEGEVCLDARLQPAVLHLHLGGAVQDVAYVVRDGAYLDADLQSMCGNGCGASLCLVEA
jgi:hypothetical protein